MIIEMDAGNSRIKWRWLDEHRGDIIKQGVCESVDELITQAMAGARPVMVRMCSVRASAVTDTLREWIADSWGLELQLARVTRRCAGVSNQYQDPQRMGADRWLAMLAAYNRSPGACVVVDAGTALTLDVVNGQGLHLGGYILPGRRLMADSLEQNTLIRLRHRTSSETVPGTDTETAVLNGILASQVALLDWAMSKLADAEAGTRLVLTGGDAELLAEQLPQQHAEVVPGLVLDGLALACPFDGEGRIAERDECGSGTAGGE